MRNRKLSAGKARRMRRLMTANNSFCIVALDQRAILARMLANLKSIEQSKLPFSAMLEVKRILVESLSAQASAMLFDPNIAVPAALEILPRDTGLLLSLEHHEIEDTWEGRKSHSIPDWSVEKIQAIGADGVKVLIWYHPDADFGVCQHQQDYVRSVGQECAKQQLPFVLELLAYKPASLVADSESNVDNAAVNAANTTSSVPEHELPDVILRSVQEFANPDYGVDLFKLQSPVAPGALAEQMDNVSTRNAFSDVGRICADAEIPWLLLSAGVSTEEFIQQLALAYAAGAQGFLAGRAIWKAPLQSYPDVALTRSRMLEQGAQALNELIDFTQKHAQAYQLPTDDNNWVVSEGDFARIYHA